jgi:uncharacterized protein YjbI with pentapeptide repeats
MTINRSTLLDLPLPVTGTEDGTWGDVTNNGLTQYLDIAIAGMVSLTSTDFTAGALTIDLTEGDSSATNIANDSAQYSALKVSSLAQNSTITAPGSNRAYKVINSDSTYSLTIKASGQTGVTFAPGTTGIVAFNGTDYEILGVVGPASATDNAVPKFDGTTGQIIQGSGVTIDDSNNVSGVAQLNATTADLTNIEVTNIKAKDGTSAGSIADSTGIVTLASSVLTTTDINGGSIDAVTLGTNSAVTEAQIDNVNINGNTIVSSDTDGDLNLTPNGTGDLVLDGLKWPQADGTADYVLKTDGSGQLSWTEQTGGGGGGGTSVTVTQATATAAQTDFSVTYTVGQLSVYLNGALLASADYTASNGTTVVLASGAAANDIFTALAYDSATQITEGDSSVVVTDSGTGKVEVTVDNVEVADFTTGAIVFNETGANQDFRVEGDTNANLIVADAGVDKVGIGTNTFNTNGGVLQVSNGISFPATQSACADVNTLDDYEEGTWTPTDGSGAGLSFTVTFATYTKIGRQVTCNAKIIYPSTANGSAAQINGLPFTSNSDNHAVSTMFTDQGAYFSLVVTQSTTALITRNLSGADLSNANLSGKTLIFTISYPSS